MQARGWSSRACRSRERAGKLDGMGPEAAREGQEGEGEQGGRRQDGSPGPRTGCRGETVQAGVPADGRRKVAGASGRARIEEEVQAGSGGRAGELQVGRGETGRWWVGRGGKRCLVDLRTLEGVTLRRSTEQLERFVPPYPGIDGRGASTEVGPPTSACKPFPVRTKDPAFAKLRGGGR